MSLTPDQRIRYGRNILAPGFGETGQARLAQARVLVVGLGGLGSPAAYYLASAGVGTLGLMDPDLVELSNLQRQILHATTDLGRPKTVSAAETLSALNPQVQMEPIAQRLEAETATEIIARYGVVIEACDNFASKFLINDLCLQLNKPFATAGVAAFSGQAQFVVPGATACLRCVLPDVPTDGPGNAAPGALGAAAGILGSIEALEVIRWVAGMWRPQPRGAGLLHHLDGETMRLKTVRIPRRAGCQCANISTE